MATIEMDISEYDMMRENKKLLEDSLKKQQELQDTIQKLNEEKIKALEDAKMKVVKITKSEVEEFLYLKRVDVDPYFLMKVQSVNWRNPSDVSYIQDTIRDYFFEKVTSTSTPVEEITTHGLDEIKSEIRDSLKQELDDSIKNKLEEADKALSKNHDLLKVNGDLVNENKILNTINVDLMEKNDNFKKELDDTVGILKKHNEITELLTKGYSFWESKKILNLIKNKIIKS